MSYLNFNPSRPASGTKESGSVMIFTVLILGSMLTITLTLLATYIPKVRAIRDAGAGSVGAIYAADSALEWCIYTNRGYSALPQPTMSNGSTYTISPADCTLRPMDHQVVGTFRGVSRSLEVTTGQ